MPGLGTWGVPGGPGGPSLGGIPGVPGTPGGAPGSLRSPLGGSLRSPRDPGLRPGILNRAHVNSGGSVEPDQQCRPQYRQLMSPEVEVVNRSICPPRL